MDINEIMAIGKVKDTQEDRAIIEKYANYIIPWLSSDEFKNKWANKPYPPLVNPTIMDYNGSLPLHAWVLNLPLPKYYEFVAFGGHDCGFHAAIPALLMLCGVNGRTMFIRSGDNYIKEEQKGSKGNYLRMYSELVRLNAAKKAGIIKHIFLQLTDLVMDGDEVKFYSLVDASKALHVVRDPINIFGSQPHCPHRLNRTKCEDNDELLPLGVFLDVDPKEFMQQHIYFCKPGENWHKTKPKNPVIDAVSVWMGDLSQNFHSVIMFNLLKNSLKQVIIKQTSDFSGTKCFDTMKELSKIFGFDEPKEEDRWLFEKRVSDYKHLLPMYIYANDKMEVFNDKQEGRKYNLDLENMAYIFEGVSHDDVRESAQLILTTRFDAMNSYSQNSGMEDVTELFSLADKVMRVFISQKTGIKLLKNNRLLQKTQEYIKMLSEEIKDEMLRVKAKRTSVDQLLEWFKTHKKEALFVKDAIEKDTAVLRKHTPQIIQSWKDYARFLEFMKDIDKY